MPSPFPGMNPYLEHSDAWHNFHQKFVTFLLAKSQARGIRVTRSSFDDEIRLRAARDYDHIKDITGESFIPFDAAWSAVVNLVNELQLPDA